MPQPSEQNRARSNPNVVYGLESIDQRGAGIRVDFRWQYDRYTHVITAIDSGDSVELLSSLEGTSDQAWPPSPPMQQLSRQRGRGHTDVLLGVGMAGTAHWSLSVEPQVDPLSLVFDVACRRQSLTGTLASCYRAMCRLEWIGQVATFILPSLSCQVTAEPTDDSRAGVLGGGIGELSIAPYLSKPLLAKTIRWKYRVSVDRT